MSTRPTPNEKAGVDADPRLQQIHLLLKRVEARLRLQNAVRLLPFAMAVAAGIFAILAILWRFWSVSSVPVLVAVGVGVLAIAIVVTTLYALLSPRDMLDTARRADHLLGLDERLSTALEDAATPPARPTPALLSLREAQLDDTVASIRGRQPERELPVSLNTRRLLPAGILLLVTLAVFFTPDFAGGSADKITPPQVAVEQKNIEVLKQAIESQPIAAQDPTLQKLLQELDALAHDLKEGNLSREEALARLSQTEEELKKWLDPQSQAEHEALDQMAEQLSSSGNEAAKQAGQALKAGDTKKAVDYLKKAAEDAAKMTPEERKALAEALRKARDSAASLDPELASRLNEAADALESNDPKAAQQALEDLAQQVQDRGQKLATQEQLEKALAQIQQSKSNIAQSGQPTPATGSGTAVANGTSISGTPSASGTSVSGTTIAGSSPLSGTPVARSTTTVVAISGTVVAGSTATAGTPGAVQGTPGAGTPATAQGQDQGQGSSEGQEQGQGQGQDQGSGQGQADGQSGNSSSGGGPPSGGWGTGHQEQVYAPPSSVSATLTPLTVQGQDNPSGEQSSTTTNTDANQTGPATVPYEQIYGQYQQQAGDALKSDYIPQGYKDLVKDYFTDIAP